VDVKDYMVGQRKEDAGRLFLVELSGRMAEIKENETNSR